MSQDRRVWNLRYFAYRYQAQTHRSRGETGIHWLNQTVTVTVSNMKKILTPGKTTGDGANKQSSMESNIVDAMRRYFRDDKGNMGDLELSIIDSVKRYFEEQPPKRMA
jgi:hypothetical protein